MSGITSKSYWVSIMVFLMVLAALSRVLKMKEPAKIIGGGATAVANLFKGVLK